MYFTSYDKIQDLTVFKLIFSINGVKNGKNSWKVDEYSKLIPYTENIQKTLKILLKK